MKRRMNLTWFLAMIVIVVGISNAQPGMLYEQFPGTDPDTMLTESGTPDYSEIVLSSEWDGTDTNNYLGRLTGWIIPPVTGNYTFWLNSDDNGRLWLSTNSDPANAALIATETGYSAMNSWAAVGDEEVSDPIALVGGNLYWIRGCNAEVAGGDHVQIGWASPEAGIDSATVIGGSDVMASLPDKAYSPSPADGEFIRYSTDATELLWTLPPSAYDANDTGLLAVECDVLFFTEDPVANPAAEGVKLVDYLVDGRVESVDLNGLADTPAHYWWQVNTYDPNDGAMTMKPGDVWTFSSARDVEMVFVDEVDGTVVNEQGPTDDIYTISLSMPPAQPVTVTVASALDIPILSGDNDVEERQVDPADGEMDRTSSDLELGYDGADGQIIGLLFNDIQLPQGATITSATVRLIAEQDEDDPVYTTIWGRLDDPGDSFTDEVWSLSTPGVDDETTAKVEWTLVGEETWWLATGDEVFSPDIGSIIQEIIDQPTWTEGRNLVIAIGNSNSEGVTLPDDQRRAESYNEDPAKAAVLHIEYAMVGQNDQVAVSQTVVVLDENNWEGVDVTVTALDDDILEANPHATTLLHVVSSADAAWDAVTANDVVVSILDNECGAWGFQTYDINTDCYADLGDLAIIAAEWLKCSTPNTGTCEDYR